MATLYIDADACPVTREAIAVAREAGLLVVLVANSTQNLSRYEGRRGITVVEVLTGRDAADFEIASMIDAGDILVTQDIGLAAMVLGRGAYAISPRGRTFSPATIDAEMELRHFEAKHRRSGGRTGGPRPFTVDDLEHFEFALRRALSQTKSG